MTKKQILAGAMALLVVAALAHVLRWRRAEADLTRVRVPTEFAFSCMACRAAWTTDLAGARADFKGGVPDWSAPTLCRVCRAPRAYLLSTCPNCRRPYLPAGIATGQARPAADPCPHCGRDVLQWRR